MFGTTTELFNDNSGQVHYRIDVSILSFFYTPAD
jgi:hypothetical protein